VPFIDMGSGTTAALAIVAAIRERDASGEGAYLDVAMLDVAAFWSGVKLDPEEGGEPAYGVFAAADGGLLTIAVLEDKFWRNLCACLGWGDWVEDPGFGSHARRQRRAAEIETRLVATIATRDRDAWIETFHAGDVPAAPAHSPSQVGLDPQIRARALVHAAGDGSGWRPVSPLPAAVRNQQLAAAPSLKHS
jgi:formyl-CoA transferase